MNVIQSCLIVCIIAVFFWIGVVWFFVKLIGGIATGIF